MNPFHLEGIPFDFFKGTFDRGRDEEVIKDHFIDSRNIKFTPKGVQTRDGSVPSIPTEVPPGDRIVRHYFVRSDGYGQVLMYLTLPSGNLYGIRNGITTLLYSNPAMLDFSINSTHSRIYFTPHDRNAGIVGEIIRYWDGTNVYPAAGQKPTALSPMVVSTAGAGVDEVQTLTIGGTPLGGNMPINTPYGTTVPLPFNFTAAQLESALRGDNERQAVWLVNAAGGSFVPGFGQQTSGAVAFNASAADFRTALESIPTIGPGNVDVLQGTGTELDPWIVLFIGSLAKQNQDLLTLDISGLTGTTPISGHVTEVLTGRTLFGVGNVFVTGTNPYVITFTGDQGQKDIPILEPINNLTGVDPTVTVVETTQGVAAGKIDKGKHFFAVAYETASGFITGIGPIIGGVFSPTSYEAPGDHKAQIDNIPIGPAGTIGRHLLATKAGELEYFFIPDATFLDNVNTSLVVDFYDSELTESADYLDDQLTEIPACLRIATYGGRAALIGFPNPDGSLIRFSRPGEPEAFDQVNGNYLVNPSDLHNLQTGFELRGMLYVGKTQGWYAIQDDGENEPALWSEALSIDKGVSAQVFGISDVPNQIEGITRDHVLVVDASGLLIFDGVFRDPDLTWKIHDIWMRINKGLINKIQILDDPVHKLIYMNVPLTRDATEINAIIFGDYSECGLYPNPKDIKWTIWEFVCNPISISLFDLDQKRDPIFRYSADDTLYRMCRAGDCHNDNGQPISSYIRFQYVAPGDNLGEVNFFGALRFRAEGSGNLDLTFYGEDNLPLANPATIPITTVPAKEYLRLTNFKAERLSVQVDMDALNEWFYITRMRLYGKMYAAQRPA